MNIDDLIAEKTNLIQSLKLLEEKIKVIDSLIALYSKTQDERSPNITQSYEGYPLIGSRKQKITYALKEANKSLTVEEIRERLKKYEPALDFAAFPLNQYCSGMAIKGEIGVDKVRVGNKNKYFFK